MNIFLCFRIQHCILLHLLSIHTLHPLNIRCWMLGVADSLHDLHLTDRFLACVWMVNWSQSPSSAITGCSYSFLSALIISADSPSFLPSTQNRGSKRFPLPLRWTSLHGRCLCFSWTGWEDWGLWRAGKQRKILCFSPICTELQLLSLAPVQTSKSCLGQILKSTFTILENHFTILFLDDWNVEKLSLARNWLLLLLC